MPVADNAVDRPLVDVVIDAIDADADLSDEVKYFVLAALEGPTSLQELLDGISTPHVPEPSADRTVEEAGRCVPDVHRCGGLRRYRPEGDARTASRSRHHRRQWAQWVSKSSFAEALEFAVTGESYR